MTLVTAAVAPQAAAYELRQVSKTYRSGTRALDHVDLTIEKGQFASVVGPSGCGKSTLLKIMAGLVASSSGHVRLGGRAVRGPRREVGMMFQQPTLLPWLSALRNVLLPIELRDTRAAAREREGRARELLESVGLDGFANAYPAQLSGGMAQRVAICRMLITEPEVLLLDEPFSALDELTRDTLNVELQRIIAGWGATAFLVTHSIAEAVMLSDIVYVMSPRPGRFTHRFEIDLPHPRAPASVEAAEYITQIRASLNNGS